MKSPGFEYQAGVWESFWHKCIRIITGYHLVRHFVLARTGPPDKSPVW